MRTKKILALFLALLIFMGAIPFNTQKVSADPAIYPSHNLSPGSTFYFDLTGQSIPGNINPALPDTSLKWVPFTYAGLVTAYSLDGSRDGNSEASVNAVRRGRCLFVADYNVSTRAAWVEYASPGLIYGISYSSGGVPYYLRSLSTGNMFSVDRGSPADNEWDEILNKNQTYIKNTGVSSFGQDTSKKRFDYRSMRGGGSPRSYRDEFYCNLSNSNGFRPVLEVQNYATYTYFSIKTVTYDMNGNGTLGNKSLTSATVAYSGKLTLPEITEANGFRYTGPGKPCWYIGSTLYKPGTEVDIPNGTILKAGYENASEQLNLPIGTYYFDLSAQNLPGTKNTALPDTSLKWIPFTYVGTVNAYSRTSVGVSTDQTVSVKDRSLFVADYNVTKAVSWEELNNADLIFGKDFSGSGANYRIRSLSAGSNITGGGESLRGLPLSNEWDQIMDKDKDYIKNTSEMYTWCQDTNASAAGERYVRGYQNLPRGVWTYPIAAKLDICGLRPVLEIPDPDTLGADGLKTVTFDMGSQGTIGDKKTLTSAKVVYTGKLTIPAITEANGFNYTGSGTGTLGWYAGSLFYEPGTTPTLAMGTVLTPGYGTAPAITGPTTLTLTEGYAATSTGAYTIKGTAPVTVAKTSGDARITWNNSTKKLDIAAGLTAGSYPVTLTADNDISPDATLNFTLTVNPTYTAKVTPNSMTFDAAIEGYGEQAAQNFIIENTGSGTITGLKTTLSNESKFEISEPLTSETILQAGTAAVKVRPKTGLSVGTHTATLNITGNNGLSLTVGLSFRVNVAPVAPTITGPTEMTLTDGYSSTSAGVYTINGTAPVTVSKTSGDSKITWNNSTKKLDIAQGLTPGSYSVTLKASNGVLPDATLTFVLTVSSVANAINVDPSSYTFPAAMAGYREQMEQVFTITNTGTDTITGLKASIPLGSRFEISKPLSADSIAPNGIATISVRPVTGLTADRYDDTLAFTRNDSAFLTVGLSFTVNPDLDAAIVTAAKDMAEGAVYNDITQAAATNETAIVNTLKATAETAINNNDVTVTINSVWPGYVLPTAGDADKPAGTDGQYGFIVTVSKGSQSQSTGDKYIYITAAPFTGISNADAVAAAKEALIDGTVDAAYGASEADKIAAVQAYVNSIVSTMPNAAGVTATVTYNSGNGKYDVALSKGSAADSKSLNMTVNADPVALYITGPTTLTLIEGYSITSTSEYTITGTAPVIVTKTSGDAKITWNDITKKLDIAAGLTAGSYPVTLTVSNGTSPDASLDFTLTVNAITTYTVTFKDWNGTVLKKEAVNEGSGATAPANPSRKGYTFTGWDKAYNNVTSDITVTAQYIEYVPPVTDADRVAQDKAALNIGFAAGDSADAVTQDLTFIDIGTVNGSAITWKSDKTEVINNDGKVTRPPFSSMDADVTVTASVYYNGTIDTKEFELTVLKFKPAVYTVTFEDWNGTLLKTETVNEGAGATAPVDPTREGYTFTGWDKAFSYVTSSITVKAQYSQNPVTLQSITLTKPPTKLIYYVGESLDISGLVVTGVYSDGSIKVEAVTASNVSGYDSSTPAANRILTITVGGKTATYTITIKAAPNNNNNDGSSESSGNGGGSSESGSRSSGASTPAVMPPASAPKPKTTVSGNTATAIITVTATVDSRGNAAATVTQAQVTATVSSVAEATKQGNGTLAVVEIKVEAPEAVKAIEVSLPKAAVDAVAGSNTTRLTVSTSIAVIAFDSKALDTIAVQAAADVKITAAKADAETLSEEVKQLVGDRPVFNFSVTSGNKTISQFGGNVSVSIPYIPKAGEDTNAIVIYCINAEGKPEIVSNCTYDPETGTIRFTTNHFSEYAVGYNKMSFKDVPAAAWYSKAVSFITARGVTTDTGSGDYSPEAKLSRGEFVVMLMKAYNIKSDTNPKDNFADAGSTYYTDYLAAAKRLGISNGVGDNRFAPDKEITRQEVFTLLYNFLTHIGQLPSEKNAKSLTEFNDANNIASWSKDAMQALLNTGTITGTDGRLMPEETLNRTQMAQVLYNLLSSQ